MHNFANYSMLLQYYLLNQLRFTIHSFFNIDFKYFVSYQCFYANYTCIGTLFFMFPHVSHLKILTKQN